MYSKRDSYKKLSSPVIGNAIAEKFGIEGVRVHKGGGVWRFYSDTNDEVGLILTNFESVYTYRMNDLTLDRWLDEFISQWREHAPRKAAEQGRIPLNNKMLGGVVS